MKLILISLALAGVALSSPIAGPTEPCNPTGYPGFGTYTCSILTGFGTSTLTGGVAAAIGNNFSFAGPYPELSASALTIDVFGFTAGPVRTGYFQVEAYKDSTADGGFAAATAKIGAFLISSSSSNEPFTLGVPFEIILTASAHVVGGASPGFSGAIFNFNLQFFDVETKLPVTVFAADAVPESSTWLLTAGGLVVLAWRRRFA